MFTATARRRAINLLDPAHAEGLQSLLSRVYGKPVELQFTKLRKPHQDADILASVAAQQLRDRAVPLRRVLRDSVWRAPLPTERTVLELKRAKQQAERSVPSRAIERASSYGSSRAESANIIRSLKLSQLSSVRMEAAGRLSKRLTANRSQRKVTRSGANAKGPAFMLRGFRKSHMRVSQRAGKRRIGAYGIRVDLGHT